MITAKLKGVKIHSAALGSAVREAAVKRLAQVGVKVQTEAKRMTRGHGKPSEPGEPPHIQSSRLCDSISVVPMFKDGKVFVIAVRPSGYVGTWYAAIHEEGLGKHPRRAYLKPALYRVQSKMAGEFKNLDIAHTSAGAGLRLR
jgi:hypothetical protein